MQVLEIPTPFGTIAGYVFSVTEIGIESWNGCTVGLTIHW